MAFKLLTEDLSSCFESLEQRAEGNSVAEILEQLEDFDFGAAVVFEGNLEVPEGQDMFSEAFWQGHGLSELEAEKWLVVVLGNVVAHGDISLTEDYGLVFGDVSCRTLYVDGEALFGCTGTCVAKSIRSSYNGVFSAIQTAITDYVVLSSDEMLRVAEAGKDLLCLDEGLTPLVNAGVLVPEVSGAERVAQAFIARIQDGEDVFVPGVTLGQLHQDLADTAVIRKGSVVSLC